MLLSRNKILVVLVLTAVGLVFGLKELIGAIDSIFIGKKEIAVVTFIQHSSRGQRIEFEITENGISRKYSNYVLSGFSIKTGDKITVFRGRFDALIERIAVQVILLFSFVNTTIVITLIALIKLIKKFNK